MKRLEKDRKGGGEREEKNGIKRESKERVNIHGGEERS